MFMSDADTAAALERLAAGAMDAQVIRAFAALSLADWIHAGAETPQIADATGCQPELLCRLLRAGAGLGLCSIDGRRLTLTAAGQLLRADHPCSIRSRVLLLSAPWLGGAWESLTDGLRTGVTPFALRHGTPVWQYLDTHPSAATTYDSAMADNASQLAQALTAVIPPAPSRTFVDIGGGVGKLLADLLDRLPGARGVLAERARTAEPARTYLAYRGLQDRARVVATDIRQSVPAGGDVYLLSRILHTWPDDQALLILRACRAAMPQGAKLFIIGRLAPHTVADDLETALTDLNMFVLYGGKERTAEEYGRLLLDAGFRSVRTAVDAPDIGIIEAD
jgi:hypothetical protein